MAETEEEEVGSLVVHLRGDASQLEHTLSEMEERLNHFEEREEARSVYLKPKIDIDPYNGWGFNGGMLKEADEAGAEAGKHYGAHLVEHAGQHIEHHGHHLNRRMIRHLKELAGVEGGGLLMAVPHLAQALGPMALPVGLLVGMSAVYHSVKERQKELKKEQQEYIVELQKTSLEWSHQADAVVKTTSAGAEYRQQAETAQAKMTELSLQRREKLREESTGLKGWWIQFTDSIETLGTHRGGTLDKADQLRREKIDEQRELFEARTEMAKREQEFQVKTDEATNAHEERTGAINAMGYKGSYLKRRLQDENYRFQQEQITNEIREKRDKENADRDKAMADAQKALDKSQGAADSEGRSYDAAVERGKVVAGINAIATGGTTAAMGMVAAPGAQAIEEAIAKRDEAHKRIEEIEKRNANKVEVPEEDEQLLAQSRRDELDAKHFLESAGSSSKKLIEAIEQRNEARKVIEDIQKNHQNATGSLDAEEKRRLDHANKMNDLANRTIEIEEGEQRRELNDKIADEEIKSKSTGWNRELELFRKHNKDLIQTMEDNKVDPRNIALQKDLNKGAEANMIADHTRQQNMEMQDLVLRYNQATYAIDDMEAAWKKMEAAKLLSEGIDSDPTKRTQDQIKYLKDLEEQFKKTYRAEQIKPIQDSIDKMGISIRKARGEITEAEERRAQAKLAGEGKDPEVAKMLELQAARQNQLDSANWVHQQKLAMDPMLRFNEGMNPIRDAMNTGELNPGDLSNIMSRYLQQNGATALKNNGGIDAGALMNFGKQNNIDVSGLGQINDMVQKQAWEAGLTKRQDAGSFNSSYRKGFVDVSSINRDTKQADVSVKIGEGNKILVEIRDAVRGTTTVQTLDGGNNGVPK